MSNSIFHNEYPASSRYTFVCTVDNHVTIAKWVANGHKLKSFSWNQLKFAT